jgi:hypothetical protein
MYSTLKIFTALFLGLSLSFCSSTPKDDSSSMDSIPSYDDYGSSASFGDDSRDTSSEAYTDDDYGDSSDYQASTSVDSSYGSDSYDEDSSSDPLPVETLKNTTVTSAQFRDGMYNIASNCNMRAEPSQNAQNEGKIPAGKRLWVEGHNDTWVKVFKRSGPVFIHKSCL